MSPSRTTPSERDLKVSNKKIIEWCEDPNAEQIDEREGGFPKVVRKGIFAIKHGVLGPEEARNQREAYRLFDPAIIKVPFVYRSFTKRRDEYEFTYLVMEYVPPGRQTQPWSEQDIKMIVEAVQHMQSFQRLDHPGPIGGGQAYGRLWNEDCSYSDRTFATTSDMQDFMNSRVYPGNIDLSGTTLVFCHLDLARRNLIFTQDGGLCILDWASAGYYPRYFEYATLMTIDPAAWPNLSGDVFRAMNSSHPLDEKEEAAVDFVMRMLDGLHHFWHKPWYPPSKRMANDKKMQPSTRTFRSRMCITQTADTDKKRCCIVM